MCADTHAHMFKLHIHVHSIGMIMYVRMCAFLSIPTTRRRRVPGQSCGWEESEFRRHCVPRRGFLGKLVRSGFLSWKRFRPWRRSGLEELCNNMSSHWFHFLITDSLLHSLCLCLMPGGSSSKMHRSPKIGIQLRQAGCFELALLELACMRSAGTPVSFLPT